MRFMATLAAFALAGTSAIACEISPQANLKLDPKDQAALVSLGKAIAAPELLGASPAAALVFKPSGVLTLGASDSRALAKALAGLRKATACQADTVVMERILEDDTPGVRFIRQIEGCLADACVDNP